MWKHQGILPYCIRLCLWWNVGWDFRFWTSLVMGNQNAGTSCSPLVGNVYKTLAVQLLIVPNLGTPWTTACQVPLSFSICWVCSNSCPLSQWCHSTNSSSAAPFSCLQSFPASGYFPVSQLFASGSQSIGTSTSTSVLLMNIQGWFPQDFVRLD